MEQEKACEIERCKANMKHRFGIHSGWCPNFDFTDLAARKKMMSSERVFERTKVEWVTHGNGGKENEKI